MLLEPAERRSLSQMVLDQILAQIREGAIRPGDRIPGEFELMKLLKVGRSSVREAMRGLVTLGLVETRPGRGAIVAARAANPLEHLGMRSRSSRVVQKYALLDLLDVREGLEGQAAGLAALRATPEDLAAMERHVAAMDKQIKQGRTYFRSNVEFHLAVARSSHNGLLVESAENLLGQVRAYRERLMREIPDMPERDVKEHRAILEAVKAGNAERARRAMVTHIRTFAGLVRRAGDGLGTASSGGAAAGRRATRGRRAD